MEKDRDQRQEAGAKCSEEIRRDLRARQRETLEDIRGNALALKMESNEANADKSVHSQVIRAARDRNNNLFKRVRHTRELNLDVEILEERTKMVVEQAQHLQKPSRYDAVRFVKALRSKLTVEDKEKGTKKFDWEQLGFEATICFNSLPARVVFLSCALAKERDTSKPKKRQTKRRRRQKDEFPVETVVVEEMKQSNGLNGEGVARATTNLTETESHLKVLKKILKEKCTGASRQSKAKNGGERRGGEIDMIPFLFNPKSFTQTIENILHFSHLVKKGSAGVRRGDDGIIYIRYRDHHHCAKEQSEGQEEHCTPPSALQVVLSLSMKDWRSLVNAYELVEGYLPDRNYTRVTPLSIGDDANDGELEEGEVAGSEKGSVKQGRARRNINSDINMEAMDTETQPGVAIATDNEIGAQDDSPPLPIHVNQSNEQAEDEGAVLIRPIPTERDVVSPDMKGAVVSQGVTPE